LWDADAMNDVLIYCAGLLNLAQPQSRGVFPRGAWVRVDKKPPPPSTQPLVDGQQRFASAASPRAALAATAATAPPPFLREREQQKAQHTGRSHAALIVDAFRSGKAWNYMLPLSNQQQRGSFSGGSVAAGFGNEGRGAPASMLPVRRSGKWR
jgi:hypothetical protein